MRGKPIERNAMKIRQTLEVRQETYGPDQQLKFDNGTQDVGERLAALTSALTREERAMLESCHGLRRR
jgi:hypothetical protein